MTIIAPERPGFSPESNNHSDRNSDHWSTNNKEIFAHWNEKAERLRSLSFTGEFLTDARSYLETKNIKVEELDSQSRTAFEQGDANGVRKYFIYLERGIENGPKDTPPEISAYNEVELETVRRLLAEF